MCPSSYSRPHPAPARRPALEPSRARIPPPAPGPAVRRPAPTPAEASLPPSRRASRPPADGRGLLPPFRGHPCPRACPAETADRRLPGRPCGRQSLRSSAAPAPGPPPDWADRPGPGGSRPPAARRGRD